MQQLSNDGEPIIVRREKQARSAQGQESGTAQNSASRVRRESPQRTQRPPMQEPPPAPAPPVNTKRKQQITGLACAVLGVIIAIALLSYSRMDDANASLSLREFIGFWEFLVQ
jgi:hypothetical protein